MHNRSGGRAVDEGNEVGRAEFVVESKDATYRLRWPDDRYYGLVRNPVKILRMNTAQLVSLARATAPDFPDRGRVGYLKEWLREVARGSRQDLPALPMLSGPADELFFIDGRHRCEALAELGVEQIPVIVG